MNNADFEDLTRKNLMGEATLEESVQLRNIVAADQQRASQWQQWRVEHERLGEALVILDLVRSDLTAAEIPADRLECLMHAAAVPSVVHRPDRAWWKRPVVWGSLAAAACIALVVAWPFSRKTSFHPGRNDGYETLDLKPVDFGPLAVPDWRIAPRGETRFTDALLTWPAAPGETFQVTLTRLEPAGVVAASDVVPPVALEKILLDGGLNPAPGVGYRVEVRRPGSAQLAWGWSFKVRSDAAPFDRDRTFTELLAAAEASLAANDEADHETWQYLLRLSPEVRASAAAQALEARLAPADAGK